MKILTVMAIFACLTASPVVRSEPISRDLRRIDKIIKNPEVQKKLQGKQIDSIFLYAWSWNGEYVYYVKTRDNGVTKCLEVELDGTLKSNSDKVVKVGSFETDGQPIDCKGLEQYAPGQMFH